MYSTYFSWIPSTLYVIINSSDKGICHMLGSVNMHFSTVLSRVLGPINILYSFLFINLFILEQICIKWLILKLKLQYFGHLMGRTDSLEKTLMLGKIEVRRKRGWQYEMVGWHHRLDGRVLATLGDDEGQGSLSYCSPRGHKELDTTEWTNNNKYFVF